MPVQIYRPNLDVIREQAQKARDYENNRKGGGDSKLAWGNIEEGPNIIRPLPPTNSRGILAKKVAKHYFQGTSLKELVDHPVPCVVSMFPEVPGIGCHICSAGDRILAQFPQLDIKRWHKPGSSYYIQAVDRRDQQPVAKLFKLSSALNNWLTLQMEALLSDGVDLTDINQGCDIRITKTIKKTKRGERTEYDKTLWNLKGLTPLHADPSVVEAILSSMVNPEEIWKFPDDEAIMGFAKVAADIQSFYMKDQYAHKGASLQLPGQRSVPAAVSHPQSQGMYQPSYAPHTPPPSNGSVTVKSPAPAPQPVVEDVVAKTAQKIVAVAQQAAPVQAPPVHAPAPSVPRMQPQQARLQMAGSGSPSDRPVCFGGKAPRPDGGIGYDDSSEVCLMCPAELTCADACREAGISATAAN